MSHFVIYVFQKANGKDLEDMLAPYDENLEVTPYIRYTKEQIIELEKKDINNFNNNFYSKYLENPNKYIKEHEDNEYHLNFIKKFPERLTWTDEECYNHYVDTWFDRESIDEDGNYWSEYNPNSKWDWYQIGGRWSNILALKNGNEVDEDYVSEVDFDKTMTPFAFIDTEGRWHEKGEMGWWCTTNNEKTEEDWERIFKYYLRTLNGDEIITVVDCHI